MLNEQIGSGYKMMELFINPLQEVDNNQVHDFLTAIIEQVVAENENDEELLNISLYESNINGTSLLNDICDKNDKVILLEYFLLYILKH